MVTISFGFIISSVCWKMLALSCVFYILWQRQFHLQVLQGRLCLGVQRGGSSAPRPFVLLAGSCQHPETAGAPALLHGHPCSGVLHSLKNSCFPQQAMKWDRLMPQATSGKLDSTARVGQQRGLHLSAAISYQYNLSYSTALWLQFCIWTSIFRNLGCARSARPRDREDVRTAFCRMMCSGLNRNNILGAMPVEIKGTWRHDLGQSQCLETRD